VSSLLPILEEEPDFTKPGKLSGMADPGRLSLEVTVGGETKTISTSLDSVVNGGRRNERAVLAVVQNIRSLSDRKTRCGFEGFFGVH